jgi:hypothetical protein
MLCIIVSAPQPQISAACSELNPHTSTKDMASRAVRGKWLKATAKVSSDAANHF